MAIDRDPECSLFDGSSNRPESRQRPTVLVLGDSNRAEMKPILAWMNEQILTSSCAFHANDADQLDELFRTDQFPDLIVVLQSWSDQFSSEEIHRLLSFAPLARVVVCYGSWCESDGRNRHDWPWSIRIPVWAAIDRIEREWCAILNSKAGLPWSASREEVFADDHSPDFVHWRRGDSRDGKQTFLIESPDIQYRNSVCDLLLAMGYREQADPDWIFFDADPWNDDRRRRLDELCSRFPNAQVAILTNSIDPSSFTELRRNGGDRVLHKLGFRDQFQSP